MSFSDSREARRYASIAETAAAQCKLYTEEARRAPEYTDLAKQYSDISEQAASSALSAAESANNSSRGASESASSAQGYANSALESSQKSSEHSDQASNSASQAESYKVNAERYAEDAKSAVTKTIRVNDIDLQPLPDAQSRAGKILTFDSEGNPIIAVPESGSAADVLSQLGSSKGSDLIGTPYGSLTDALAPSQDVISGELNFQSGGVVNSARSFVWDKLSGSWWFWSGEYPKNVTPGMSPLSDSDPNGKWLSTSGIDIQNSLAKGDGSQLGYRYKGLPNASRRTVLGKLDETVSLWDFHCDEAGNIIQPGPTVDSRPYIQNAIDYLNANGGGTLQIPKITGKWYLSSFGTGAITGHSGVIQLKSHVSICLEGDIQLSNFFDLKSFQVFVGFDNSDPELSGNIECCHIYGGGSIDFGGFYFANSSQLRSGITLGRSYNCSIEDITLQNGDMTWAITTGWNGYGSYCYVRRCRIKNLVTSNINPDHSSIYVGSTYSGVDYCSFEMDSERGNIIACTVELHQHNTFYRNSSIRGYCRGVYVVMHAAESSGAGLYSYNINVESVMGEVYGQFCVLGSDEYNNNYSHVSGVTISNNNINIAERDAFSAPFGAFIDIGPDNLGRRDVQDVSSIMVTGNTFRSPANVTDSAALTVNAKLNGISLSDNFFDCRYMIYGDSNTATSVAVNGLVWSETNVIGQSHAGERGSLNLFNMQFLSMNNSSIHIRFSSEDTSMFSVILFPSSCSLTYSSIEIEADFTKNMTNTAVFEAGQQNGANVYVSYPDNLSVVSYNTTGSVPFFSTDASYGWVTSAQPIYSADEMDGYILPAAYSPKGNGQIFGLGYNEVGEVRTARIRVMLKRFL